MMKKLKVTTLVKILNSNFFISQNKKQKFCQILGYFFIGLFIILGYIVKYQPLILKTLDSKSQIFIRSFINPIKTEFFIVITQLGSTLFLTIFTVISIVFLIKFKKYIFAIYIFFNLAIVAGVINVLLKNYFQRQRPDLLHLVKETSFSFPSGHSLGSVLFYGTWFVFCSYFFKNKIYLNITRIFLIALTLIIGVSRIYLGVHYPSDVVGSFFLGFGWILLSFPKKEKSRQKMVRPRGFEPLAF